MKVKIISGLFLLLCGTWLFGAGATADFKAAVQAAVKDFPAAIAAKDAAKVASFYAKDAMVLPPNSEIVTGKDGIQNLWKGFIDAGMNVQFETVDIESQGNLGVEVGKYSILDSAGKTVDQGKYVVVYKKEAGTWKLYRDTWNTSMPAK